MEDLMPISTAGPVRKISRGSRSIRGSVTVHGCRVEFESLLERDFLTLLHGNRYIARVVAQPLRVPVNGRRPYTPDFLIDTEYPNGAIKSTLVEVKYRKDLFIKWKRLKPALKAARKYASERGAKFRIFTELEIRGPALRNSQVLAAYLRTAHSADEAGLSAKLAATSLSVGPMTIKELIDCSFITDEWRQRATPVLFRMLAERRLCAELGRENLSMNTEVWTSSDNEYWWGGL